MTLSISKKIESFLLHLLQHSSQLTTMQSASHWTVRDLLIYTFNGTLRQRITESLDKVMISVDSELLKVLLQDHDQEPDYELLERLQQYIQSAGFTRSSALDAEIERLSKASDPLYDEVSTYSKSCISDAVANCILETYNLTLTHIGYIDENINPDTADVNCEILSLVLGQLTRLTGSYPSQNHMCLLRYLCVGELINNVIDTVSVELFEHPDYLAAENNLMDRVYKLHLDQWYQQSAQQNA